MQPTTFGPLPLPSSYKISAERPGKKVSELNGRIIYCRPSLLLLPTFPEVALLLVTLAAATLTATSNSQLKF